MGIPKRHLSVKQCFVSHSSIQGRQKGISFLSSRKCIDQSFIVLPSIEMNERNEERWTRISSLSNVWSVQPLCLTMNRSNRKTNLIWESSNIKEEKTSADDLLFHWLTKINTRTFLLSIIFTGITVFREKIFILIREINEHTFPLQTTIETIPRERENVCVWLRKGEVEVW